MKKHFKTRIVEGLASTCANFKPLPPGFARRARGVRYFSPVLAINVLWGAMDRQSEGRQHKKHVIVRRTHCRHRLLQLYVYRFPKQWSAACQENRAIQAVARRRAHDLEHDYSRAALEYRIRFLSHYFRVFKGGEKPAEGMKPYSRFFHYTYVYILRELYAAKAQLQATQLQSQQEEGITFEPIERRPLSENVIRRTSVRCSLYGTTSDAACPANIPPNVRSRPAGHTQIRLLFRRRRTPLLRAPINLLMRA